MINEDNVIINTPEKELETEPQNIPQGEKPFINPNPGYGYVDPVTGESETKPAIKTEPVSGERGIKSEVVTPLKEGLKIEHNLVNFLKGLLIKGKPLEEYIDSQGGVTEEELQAALANYYTKNEVVANPSDNNGADLTGLQIGNTKFKVPEGLGIISYNSLSDTLASADLDKLLTGKYCLKAGDYMFYPTYNKNSSYDSLCLVCFESISDFNKMDLLVIDTDNLVAGNPINDDPPQRVKLSEGTKLYEHIIAMGDNVLTIVSSRPTAYSTSNQLVGDFPFMASCIYYNDEDEVAGTVLNIMNDEQDIAIYYFKSDDIVIAFRVEHQIGSDTVTPL